MMVNYGSYIHIITYIHTKTDVPAEEELNSNWECDIHRGNTNDEIDDGSDEG